MAFPRDAVGVSVLGDKVYAVGGYDGQHYLKVSLRQGGYDGQHYLKVSLRPHHRFSKGPTAAVSDPVRRSALFEGEATLRGLRRSALSEG